MFPLISFLILIVCAHNFVLETSGSMQKHLEQRAVIKFHAAQKKSAVHTWRELRQVHGEDCMSQASV